MIYTTLFAITLANPIIHKAYTGLTTLTGCRKAVLDVLQSTYPSLRNLNAQEHAELEADIARTTRDSNVQYSGRQSFWFQCYLTEQDLVLWNDNLTFELFCPDGSPYVIIADGTGKCFWSESAALDNLRWTEVNRPRARQIGVLLPVPPVTDAYADNAWRTRQIQFFSRSSQAGQLPRARGGN